MLKENGLPKAERLCSLHAQRRLFAEGVSGFVYPFRYTTYIEESTLTTVEVLFSVPKRNHKRANRRNLLRRRTKEAYRLQKQPLWQTAETKGVAVDLALVYSSKDVIAYKTIEHAVRRILEEVAARC